MSKVVTLEEVKQDLKVTHDADDTILRTYIDAAENEALQFMDRESFGDVCPCDEVSSEEVSSETPVIPASVKTAVFFLVRGMYDASTPETVRGYRAAAETLLMPFRCRLGV